jgi:3-hydroxyisobutyrate dehydrogenase-like beta-hydroxyacid dehydrogenase
MKIGFIGLGIMGSRMAANLLDAGNDLVVYNRTKSKADPLVAKGAAWANDPSEVGAQVQVLFTMLAKPDVVEKIALGSDGFLDHLKEGALWVDCSTVNPSFSQRMASEARQRGVHFLDAPVAGTKGPAEEGELLILVGGKDQDVKTCQPYFNVMGRKVIHVGENGMGTSMKMVINMLLAEAMLAFSEALVLGQSLGIPRQKLFDILVGGPVVAPFISGKRPVIEKGEYQAAFPLKWMTKDLQLVSVTGYEQQVALPVANLAKEVFALAMRRGLADKDFSAVYEFLKEERV